MNLLQLKESAEDAIEKANKEGRSLALTDWDKFDSDNVKGDSRLTGSDCRKHGKDGSHE